MDRNNIQEHNKNYKTAYKYVSTCLGEDYIKINKRVLPDISPILYQKYDAAHIINNGLRNNIISPFVFKIITELDAAIESHKQLDVNIDVFRSIPKHVFESAKNSGILHDNAFNSVSLDPNVSLFFGDCLLLIHLNPSDKMLYLGGKNYFHDIFECILPRGMEYLILSEKEISMGEKNIKLIEVQSKGVSQKKLKKLHPTDVMINFDNQFIEIFTFINNFLSSNKSSPIRTCAALIYKKEKGKHVKSWFHSLVPNTSILHSTNKIIHWFEYYVDMFDKIISICLVSHNEAIEAPEEFVSFYWEKNGFKPSMPLGHIELWTRQKS